LVSSTAAFFSQANSSLLTIDRLAIRFRGKPVVEELSLSIEPGQVLGLVGESGSGKSVTSLAILGLLDKAAQVTGSIRFAGEELLTLRGEAMRSYRGRRIAMIFQEPMTALNPVMTIGRQIAEAIETHQPTLTRRKVRAAVIASLEAVALPQPDLRYNDYPHQFSGGQRQRILIAMALANRPQLLIADEPTTALDVTVQAQVLELLRELRREFGLAMLFISHDLGVVAEVTDQVAVMRHGWLLEQGTREQIFHTPQHPYTRSLLGAVPTLTTDRTRPLATLPAAMAAAPGPWVQYGAGHQARALS
jgi:peptide/nickel transport system ATP-binding protein